MDQRENEAMWCICIIIFSKKKSCYFIDIKIEVERFDSLRHNLKLWKYILS